MAKAHFCCTCGSKPSTQAPEHRKTCHACKTQTLGANTNADRQTTQTHTRKKRNTSNRTPAVFTDFLRTHSAHTRRNTHDGHCFAIRLAALPSFALNTSTQGT